MGWPHVPLRDDALSYARHMERNTRQRWAIREALLTAGRPLLPQEVLEGAQTLVPGLGIATVYRNLKALVDDGEVHAVHLPAESPRYEAAHRSHHHHFQCRQCLRVFDIDACPGDLAFMAPLGFSVDAHEITLYGRCADCAAPVVPSVKKRASRARA